MNYLLKLRSMGTFYSHTGASKSITLKTSKYANGFSHVSYKFDQLEVGEATWNTWPHRLCSQHCDKQHPGHASRPHMGRYKNPILAHPKMWCYMLECYMAAPTTLGHNEEHIVVGVQCFPSYPHTSTSCDFFISISYMIDRLIDRQNPNELSTIEESLHPHATNFFGECQLQVYNVSQVIHIMLFSYFNIIYDRLIDRQIDLIGLSTNEESLHPHATNVFWQWSSFQSMPHEQHDNLHNANNEF